MESNFSCGAAVRKITPKGNVFLYGYPHAPRISTGIHDDLLCSALYLNGREGACLLISNDLIFVSRDLVDAVRIRISLRTGLYMGSIAICATHTHSGPVTVDYLSNKLDPTVPKADRTYLDWLASQMIEAGCEAIASAENAEMATMTVEVTGVGTNRHNVSGAADTEACVIALRRIGEDKICACAFTYAMHPTVLHEDSTLVSSDFPHYAREHIKKSLGLRDTTAILFLNGASGNLSPRHTARSNTFAEAERLGRILGDCILSGMAKMSFTSNLGVFTRRTYIALEPREMPSVVQANDAMTAASARLHQLRENRAPKATIRSAECDLFGAEETLALAKSVAEGSFQKAITACLPAEIQVIHIGSLSLVFWPGEFFVEYALEIKAQQPNTHVVTLANGILQGYIVTPEAERQKLYESGNAVFSSNNGRTFVRETLALLKDGKLLHAASARN